MLFGKRWGGRCAAVLALALCAAGCTVGEDSAVYVDSTLADLPPDIAVTTANPKPVQLIFEFQTSGVANPQFADMWGKAFVTDTVKKSGLFSEVRDTPVPGGAVLKIVVNNVALHDDKSVKDFLRRSTVGINYDLTVNGYICTVDYAADSTSPKVSKEVRDVIYGADPDLKNPVKRAEKMPSLQMAVTVAMRRLVSNGVNEIAKDPEFLK